MADLWNLMSGVIFCTFIIGMTRLLIIPQGVCMVSVTWHNSSLGKLTLWLLWMISLCCRLTLSDLWPLYRNAMWPQVTLFDLFSLRETWPLPWHPEHSLWFRPRHYISVCYSCCFLVGELKMSPTGQFHINRAHIPLVWQIMKFLKSFLYKNWIIQNKCRMNLTLFKQMSNLCLWRSNNYEWMNEWLHSF